MESIQGQSESSNILRRELLRGLFDIGLLYQAETNGWLDSGMARKGCLLSEEEELALMWGRRGLSI